nr:MAG TPA: hypothetical protein [Caudoviricetes sp.]
MIGFGMSRFIKYRNNYYNLNAIILCDVILL